MAYAAYVAGLNSLCTSLSLILTHTLILTHLFYSVFCFACHSTIFLGLSFLSFRFYIKKHTQNLLKDGVAASVERTG